MTVLNLAVSAGGDDGRSIVGGAFDSAAATIITGRHTSAGYHSFIRFPGVTIPQGATIASAVLALTADGLAGTLSNIHLKVLANAADNATAPTDTTTHTGKARTAAGVDFDPAAWVAGTTYNLPDIAAVIQEVISRPGWSSGNALLILIDDDGSSASSYLLSASYEHATRQEPRLVITYTVLQVSSGGGLATVEVSASGAGVGPQNSSGGSTATVEVSASGAGVLTYPPTPSAIPGIAWRGRIALEVEVGRRGAAVGEAVWDSALWDGGAWSGLEPIWVTLDGCNVSSLKTNRGRLAGTDRFTTGTATAVLEWELGEAAWSFRPEAPVTLGDELRIRARVDGGEAIPIWRGQIKRLADQWTPGVGRLTANVGMVDRLADLAAVTQPGLIAPVGAGELSGVRIARILAAAEIPDYYYDLDTGVTPVQATELERNLLDEAQITAEAEPGQFYVDRSSNLAYRGRSWRTDEPRSAATQLIWASAGNADTVPPSTAISAFATEQNTDLIANQVTRARAGGAAYTVRDETGILLYGLRTNQRLDLICSNDADVEYAADQYLAQRSRRVNEIGPLSAVVDPYSSGRVIEALIDIELLDRHELEWDDGSGLGVYSEVLHVQAISHNVTPALWTVTAGVWAYRDLEV